MRIEVDSQVAAPAEMSNTQLAPSGNRSHKSADGRVATEAAWLKPKTKDSDRKRKNDLTRTGLLMEGLGNVSSQKRLPCDVPTRMKRPHETARFEILLFGLMFLAWIWWLVSHGPKDYYTFQWMLAGIGIVLLSVFSFIHRKK